LRRYIYRRHGWRHLWPLTARCKAGCSTKYATTKSTGNSRRAKAIKGSSRRLWRNSNTGFNTHLRCFLQCLCATFFQHTCASGFTGALKNVATSPAQTAKASRYWRCLQRC
jgi:hypothetical protein